MKTENQNEKKTPERVSAVRRWFRFLIGNAIIEAEKLDEISKPKEIVEKKIIHINILLNDGTNLWFSRTYPKNLDITYVQCYYSFYKWFFYRNSSEWYSFGYKEGTMIFKKYDIKRVEFLYEYKSETVA